MGLKSEESSGVKANWCKCVLSAGRRGKVLDGECYTSS